jgi:hypothetical protein
VKKSKKIMKMSDEEELKEKKKSRNKKIKD